MKIKKIKKIVNKTDFIEAYNYNICLGGNKNG